MIINFLTKQKDEISYKSAADSFESLGDYKDASQLQKECTEKALIHHNDTIYEAAMTSIAENPGKGFDDIMGFTQTITMLQTISGWKDADEKIAFCRQKIEEIRAKEEIELAEAQRRGAERREAAEKAAKRRKIIFSILASITVIGVTFYLIWNYVVIPNRNYDAAIAYLDNGNYVEAYERLLAMDGYKDSTAKAEAIYEDYKVQLLQTAEVGDFVYFGTYQ